MVQTIFLIGCLALAVIFPVQAVTFTWAGASDGTWGTAGNWAGGTVPTAGTANTVVITNLGAYQVTFDESTAANDPDPGGPGSWLTITKALFLGASGANPTLLVDFTSPVTLLITNSGTGAAAISLRGNSSFILSNGTVSTGASPSTIRIGDAVGSAPTLAIYGGTLQAPNNLLHVGYTEFSTGTLITAGGILEANNVRLGAVNATTVNAFGSWFARGNSSNFVAGTLNIGTGSNSTGRLVIENNAYVAVGALNLTLGTGVGMNNTGLVYVLGGQFVVTNTAATPFSVGGIVGGGNYGLFAVSNGLAEIRGNATIGQAAGNMGEVVVAGGLMNLLGQVIVGANAATSTGRVTVTDAGILELNNNTLTIGNAGVGFFTNKTGGTVRFTGLNNPGITVGAQGSFVTTNAIIEFKNANAANLTANIASAITYQGLNTLSLNNSTNVTLASYTLDAGQNFATLRLTNNAHFRSRDLVVGTAGGVQVIGSHLHVTNAWVNAGQLDLRNGTVTGGTITNTGWVTGVGSVASLVVTQTAGNFGTLSPGNSTGLFTVTGPLTLSTNAVVVMEVLSTGQDQIVAGALTVGGGKLTLAGSYAALAGTVFVLVENLSGTPWNGTDQFFGLTNGVLLTAANSGIGVEAHYQLFYDYVAGGDSVANDIVIVAIPEPSAILLVMVGLAGAVLLRSRWRN